jgi:hypothetical protein
MNTTEYAVVFEPFTERHFIKTFARKYKGAWDITLSFLAEEFRFVDVLFNKSIAEHITDKHADVVICKTEFKIAGSQRSRHASGNRCIIAVRKSTAVVRVLLVYNKGDISDSNETAGWKTLVKESCPEYRGIL